MAMIHYVTNYISKLGFDSGLVMSALAGSMKAVEGRAAPQSGLPQTSHSGEEAVPEPPVSLDSTANSRLVSKDGEPDDRYIGARFFDLYYRSSTTRYSLHKEIQLRMRNMAPRTLL
ncbi:unnamed protein product [Tilletia laevis]|uniref:Uncharacterized protein n=1 Tax=Tilletia caries TaxID=13290 RepID=A0ABN7IWP6_9BASI|nr:unnamed protein product [Tilletia caries]CAD6924670.1 unnamed protein product [Tilletia caries]CAD6929499.1 unnamed protein product [Tilletia caries]CAD6958972.1 unnamed protein product [Tilletia laevis]CAD7060007.1 unnamed protein product [Tilletia caries]